MHALRNIVTFSITTDCSRFNVDDDMLRNFPWEFMSERDYVYSSLSLFIIFLCTYDFEYVSFNRIRISAIFLRVRYTFMQITMNLTAYASWVKPFLRVREKYWTDVEVLNRLRSRIKCYSAENDDNQRAMKIYTYSLFSHTHTFQVHHH